MVKGVSRRMNAHGVPGNLVGLHLPNIYGQDNCIFLLQAQSLTGLVNNQLVSSWTDSVRNISFSNSVPSNQPRFIESNPAYNGLPTVESISFSRRLLSSSGLFLPKEYTFVMIANYNTLTTINSVMGNSAADFCMGMGGAFSGINGAFVRNNAAVQIVSGTTEDTTPKIVAISSKDGIMVNGILENSNELGPYNQSLNVLFSGTGASNVNLFGHIAEIVAYGMAFSSEQLLQISNLLNEKYALY